MLTTGVSNTQASIVMVEATFTATSKRPPKFPAYRHERLRESFEPVFAALRESLSTGARTQQVIITVKPGHRADIRQALEAHGDVIGSEHPSIDALAAEIHSLDVDEIARHPWVLSVSADAVVFAGAASSASTGAISAALASARLAIVLIVLPILFAASRHSWYPRAMSWVSLAIAWLALLWLLERGFGLVLPGLP